MRDYNLKMIDMARVNTEGVFEFARQLATAKSPSEMVELWTSHARKQFEMLSEQLTGADSARTEDGERKRRPDRAQRRPGFQESLLTALSLLGGRFSPAYPHRGNLHHPHRPDPTIMEVVSFFVVDLA
jgi:hypothetical protein